VASCERKGIRHACRLHTHTHLCSLGPPVDTRTCQCPHHHQHVPAPPPCGHPCAHYSHQGNLLQLQHPLLGRLAPRLLLLPPGLLPAEQHITAWLDWHSFPPPSSIVLHLPLHPATLQLTTAASPHQQQQHSHSTRCTALLYSRILAGIVMRQGSPSRYNSAVVEVTWVLDVPVASAAGPGQWSATHLNVR
jgi:hypothetical protein